MKEVFTMSLHHWKALALAVLLAAFLTGCGDAQLHGVVQEIQTGDDGQVCAFIIQTGAKQVGVLLTGETRLYPAGEGAWASDELRAAFESELQPGTEVSIRHLPGRKKLTAEDGSSVTAYEADSIDIMTVLKQNAAALSDGTPLDIVEFSPFSYTYKLTDGTELLWVSFPIGPENSYVIGKESYDDLSEQAKERVSAYYEEQGLLYNEAEELEKAYAVYLEEGSEFQGCSVQQTVSPSASSERVLYFLTTVSLPLFHGDGCTNYELRRGAAFNRETGEVLNPWDLFTCPEAEVKQAILKQNEPLGPELLAEMEAVSWAERLVMFPDRVEIGFEAGTLPSEAHTCFLYADFDSLPGLLQPWAVPIQKE